MYACALGMVTETMVVHEKKILLLIKKGNKISIGLEFMVQKPIGWCSSNLACKIFINKCVCLISDV